MYVEVSLCLFRGKFVLHSNISVIDRYMSRCHYVYLEEKLSFILISVSYIDVYQGVIMFI